MLGKGSIHHNERKFTAENVDKERSKNNVTYYNEDIKTVYHKLFDDALKKYNERQKRNDRMIYVFSAHLHMDEATPHLHIDFVPFTTDSKRGLDTRVSMKSALKQQGFTGTTRSDTEFNQWINFEKEKLSEIMLGYGI